MSVPFPVEGHSRRWRPWVAALVATAVVAVGLAGAGRYVWTFWRYRGFPPPSSPASVIDRAGRQVPVTPSRVETITIPSPAVGGPQQVLVVLPPGYDTHPHRRYPVLYLLHGVPGQASDFLTIGDAATTEATLVAQHQLRPMLLVIPQGAGFLRDTEWADGIRAADAWETFVARDLVAAIDTRYRTIPSGQDRAIGGLSEGGYAALNIGLHHLGEFSVLESWSGYMDAPDVTAVFGRDTGRRLANSPSALIRADVADLRRARIVLWFYCGTTDYEVASNKRFDAELNSLGVPHTFFVANGSHNWRLWRTELPDALTIASRRFGHG